MNTTPFPRFQGFARAVKACLALLEDPTPSRVEARSEREFGAAIRPGLLSDFANGGRDLWVAPSPTRH